MIKNVKKLNLIFWLIASLYLTMVIYWLYLNDFTTAHVDDTNYLTKSLYLTSYAKQGFTELTKAMIFIHSSKPPLLIWFFSFIALFFGNLGHEVVLTTGILLLNIFLIINIYCFFTWIVKNPLARNWTLALFAINPLLFSISKLVMTELLLLNCILLTINLLKLYGDRAAQNKIFLIGLIVALGTLSKATFLFFVIAPIFYYRKFLLKHWGSFVLGFSLALPWYLIHSSQVFRKFFQAADFARHSDGSVSDPLVLVNYLFDLCLAFGPFLLILLLLVFRVSSIKEILSNQYLKFVFIAPTMNLILFCFVSNKNERFQFISFFFLIVVLAILVSISKKTLTAFVVITLQFLFTINFCFHQFTDLLKPKVLYMTRPYKSFFQETLKNRLNPIFENRNTLIAVDPILVNKGIEVEFQYDKKNPRSIDDHLKLLKADKAWVPNYLKSYSFKELLEGGFTRSYKSLKPENYDYAISVSSLFGNSYQPRRGFSKLLLLGESQKDGIRFELFESLD